MQGLPITLATASALGILLIVLAVRCIQGRFAGNVAMGDGGNPLMIERMRTMSNFVEYAPLFVLLLGLLEANGAEASWLKAAAAAFVIVRISHIIGMPRPAPNPFRMIGAMGTFVLILGLSVWGLMRALPAVLG